MMKRLKRNRGLLCLLLAALLALPAAAAGTYTLTVRYHRAGVDFSLYQVGTPAGESWAMTGPFAGYAVVLPEGDSSAGVWRTAAETLAAYAALDGISPDSTQTTSGGQAQFSGLEAGLYLIVGESHRQDEAAYTPIPALVAVAGDATVELKAETPPPEGGDATYQVVKVWAGGESQRMESVTLQLICNGQPDRTVTLSAENDWSYRWTSGPGHTWQVAELDVPEGFTVSVDRENGVFTVTNTWPGEPDEPEEPDKPEGPNLPYTGQLWWPVPVLLFAGGVLLIVDRVRSRQKGSKDDG